METTLTVAMLTFFNPEHVDSLILPAVPKKKDFFVPKDEEVTTVTRGLNGGNNRDTGTQLATGWITGRQLLALLEDLEAVGMTASFLFPISKDGKKGQDRVVIGQHDESFRNMKMDGLSMAVALDLDRRYGVSGWDNPGRDTNITVYGHIGMMPRKMPRAERPLEISHKVVSGKLVITKWEHRP